MENVKRISTTRPAGAKVVAATVAAVLATIGGAAAAASPADSILTVDDCVARAVRHNPRLAAAAAGADAAAAVPGQTGAFPDPRLGFGYYVTSPETRVGPMQYVVTLSQTLPFFGKRALAADVTGAEARVARSGYMLELIDLTWRVKETYYEYQRLYNVRVVLEEEKRVLDHMEEVAQVKYASGTVGQQDVLRAQLELSQVEDELSVNGRDLETNAARLVELLNLDPRAVLPPPERVFLGTRPSYEATDAQPDSLFESYARHRPEIQAASIEAEKAEAWLSLAKRRYFPDLTLGVQYVNVGKREIDVTDNGKDIWQVTAAVNIPIWLGSRGDGVDEAQANRARSRSDRAWVELRVRGEIRDALERVRSAHERLRLYGDVILPQAEHAYEAAEAGYRAGTVGFLDYLEGERTVLAARRRYLGVVADLGKQQAYMDRVLGTDLRYAADEER